MRFCQILAVCTLYPRFAFAHSGAHGPHDLLQTWTLEPVVVLGIALLACAYAWGGRRGGRRRRPTPRWRMACHWLGVSALVLTLISPLDALGDLLFSGHMVQHLVLTMIAAPLFVLGDAGLVTFRALPIRARHVVGRGLSRPATRRFWHRITAPVTTWTLHTATLLVWHLPVAYELAVRNDAVHALEHASFFLTALLFWWPVAAPRARARLNFGGVMFYLFTSATVAGVLGAAITLSKSPWYSVHDRWTAAWGLTPLDDQHLAGLIMWVPAGMLYLIAVTPVVIGALRERPRRGSRAAATIT